MQRSNNALSGFGVLAMLFWMSMSLVEGLLLRSPVTAREALRVLSGSWTASAGGDRLLRGTWSAQIAGPSRNAAQGSWSLVSDAGDVVMEGTWSVRKAGQAWEGTWTARVLKGGTLSGRWSADLKDFAGRTMEEMLQRTTEKQVAGAWQSGRNQGYWWLEGAKQKPKRR